MYERGETLSHAVTVRNFTTTAKENPESIKITITSPDDIVLVSAASMVSDGVTVGEYIYNYTIPETAIYGEYTIEVDTVKSSSTTTSKHNFMVMSWEVVNMIRRYSGITKESVSDDDIVGIALEVYREVADDVFIYHDYESPTCDPNYDALFDGSNTIVRSKYTHIADHDFDGQVYGIGNLSRNTDWIDVAGYWIDSTFAKQTAKITVTDKVTGRMTITQTSGVAIPSTHNGVYIRYWTEWNTFNSRLFMDAIAYLAAHHLILRMTEAHKATIADLPSNQRKIELNLTRFEAKYYKIREQIAKPYGEGV
jgi:hypothetical protein